LQKILFAGAMACVLGLASNSYADPVTFFGEDTNGGDIASSHPNSDAARAAFFSNLTGGVGTETFETIPNGTSTPIAVSFGTAGTATLSGTGFVETGASSSDQFPISGTNYFDTDGTFTIAFSTPISAFGFYGTDIGDVNAALSLTLTGSNGTSTLDVPDQIGPDANGSALYFGFYDLTNTYTSISFAGAGSDIFGFDDFSIGTIAQVAPAPAPEPTTISLLGLSLFGLAAARRARR
jgi:hypothetical protein